MNLNSYEDIKSVVDEYIDARTEALMLDCPRIDKYSTEQVVRASLVSDFLFVVSDPDPKDCLKYQIRIWRDRIAKDTALLYEAGEQVAAEIEAQCPEVLS